ncbi:hypothetical protein BB561_001603 [Smittium simulii]|uniref:Bromo domain-containing protein n=1 Tax=Smittium simulii TaxID=133385 RepID=A0A2T9YTT6_9FUNG|nr:hypothetical protein BB561_001603 [Smittium simulii]
MSDMFSSDSNFSTIFSSKSFSRPAKWDELGFQIALALQKYKLWEVYIRQEHLHFIYQALLTKNSWLEFVSFTKKKWLTLAKAQQPDNCFESILLPNHKETSVASTVTPENADPYCLDSILAAVGARAIVFDQFLSVIYPLNCENCSNGLEQPLDQFLDFDSIVKTHFYNAFKFDSTLPSKNSPLQTSSNLLPNDETIASETTNNSNLFNSKNSSSDIFEANNPIRLSPRKILEFDDFDDESDSDTSNNPTSSTTLPDLKPNLNSGSPTLESKSITDLNSKWVSNALTNTLSNPIDLSDKSKSLLIKTESTAPDNLTLPHSHELILPKLKKFPVGQGLPLLDTDHSILLDSSEWLDIKSEIELFIQNREENNKNDSLISQMSNLTNLKNLATFIDKNNDKIELPSFEIANLLAEVRPKKSKWASDEVPGLEDLYLGLENTLSELRAMGNTVLPFLTQVKRRDAPDYYDVISNPMDFSNISKRLKNFYYRSKLDFENDIRLIRNNCFQYNTAPNHPYRKQADAVLKKAEHLLAKVPDIVVPERHPTELDEEQNTEFGDDSDTGTASELSFMGSKNKFLNDLDASYSTPKSNPKRSGTPLSSLNLDFEKCSYNKTPSDHQASYDNKTAEPEKYFEIETKTDLKYTTETNMLTQPETSITPQKRSISQISLHEIQKLSGSLFLDSIFYEKETKQFRANNIKESLKRQNQEFADQKALIRTPALMAASTLDSHVRFLDLDNNSYLETEILITEAKNILKEVSKIKSSVAESAKEKFLQKKKLDSAAKELKIILSKMENYISQLSLTSNTLQTSPFEITSGLPDFMAISNYYIYPKNDMLECIVKSITNLQKARIVDNKINTLKFNISVGYYEGSLQGDGGVLENSAISEDFKLDLSEQNNNYFNTTYFDKYSYSKNTTNPSELINRDSAAFFTRQICSLMLAHAGFEKLTKPTLNLMSEVVIQYILNLGLTLRIYTDKYSKSMSTEAILAHVMCENGIESTEDLKYYCQDKIEKAELRLESNLNRLVVSFKDLISGAVSNQSDNLGEFNADDSLIKGDLAAVGEDFFGFRELGLDKELGIDISKGIPSELWFGKTKNKYNGITANTAIQDLQYIPPPLWKQVSDLKGQVGIFIPFLSGKLDIPPPNFDFASSNNQVPSDKASDFRNPYTVIEEYLRNTESRGIECDPIPEDEFLPPRSRYGNGTRPKVPPPNYLTKKELLGPKVSNPKNLNKKPVYSVGSTLAPNSAIKKIEPPNSKNSSSFSWLNGLSTPGASNTSLQKLTGDTEPHDTATKKKGLSLPNKANTNIKDTNSIDFLIPKSALNSKTNNNVGKSAKKAAKRASVANMDNLGTETPLNKSGNDIKAKQESNVNASARFDKSSLKSGKSNNLDKKNLLSLQKKNAKRKRSSSTSSGPALSPMPPSASATVKDA